MSYKVSNNERYDEWNEIKKYTINNKRKLSIKEREIFWVKIGQNIGDEEYGKGEIFSRPVVVIRKLTNDLFLGVPTTTASKVNDDYFHNIKYLDKHQNNIISVAMLLQLKAFSKKRITSKIGKVNIDDFKNIQDKLVKIIVPT